MCACAHGAGQAQPIPHAVAAAEAEAACTLQGQASRDGRPLPAAVGHDAAPVSLADIQARARVSSLFLAAGHRKNGPGACAVWDLRAAGVALRSAGWHCHLSSSVGAPPPTCKSGAAYSRPASSGSADEREIKRGEDVTVATGCSGNGAAAAAAVQRCGDSSSTEHAHGSAARHADSLQSDVGQRAQRHYSCKAARYGLIAQSVRSAGQQPRSACW